MNLKFTSFSGISFAVFIVLLSVFAVRFPEMVGQYTILAAGGILTLLGINFSALMKQQGSFRWREPLLSGLFLLGAFGTIASLSSVLLKLVVGVAAAGAIYFYQFYFPDERPRQFEDFFVTLTAFLLLIFIWAVNFYFTPAWWLTLLLISTTMLLLFSYVFYKIKIPVDARPRFILVATFLSAEVAWALLYWPTHFLTTAVVGLMVFYLLYMFSRLKRENRLDRRQIYFHTGLMVFLLLVVLLSSPWGI